MRSTSIQFAWMTREDALRSHNRMGKGGDTYGDRVALLNRATRNTRTAAERVAARLYHLLHSGRRIVKAIKCSMCQTYMGAVDIPTPETLKVMLADVQKSGTKVSVTNAALLGMASTMLPMLPPEAFDLIGDAMPHICPACVREYNILGSTPEDASNGSGISDTEGEAPGSGEQGTRGPTRGGEVGRG